MVRRHRHRTVEEHVTRIDDAEARLARKGSLVLDGRPYGGERAGLLKERYENTAEEVPPWMRNREKGPKHRRPFTPPEQVSHGPPPKKARGARSRTAPPKKASAKKRDRSSSREQRPPAEAAAVAATASWEGTVPSRSQPRSRSDTATWRSSSRRTPPTKARPSPSVRPSAAPPAAAVATDALQSNKKHLPTPPLHPADMTSRVAAGAEAVGEEGYGYDEEEEEEEEEEVEDVFALPHQNNDGPAGAPDYRQTGKCLQMFTYVPQIICFILTLIVAFLILFFALHGDARDENGGVLAPYPGLSPVAGAGEVSTALTTFSTKRPLSPIGIPMDVLENEGLLFTFTKGSGSYFTPLVPTPAPPPISPTAAPGTPTPPVLTCDSIRVEAAENGTAVHARDNTTSAAAGSFCWDVTCGGEITLSFTAFDTVSPVVLTAAPLGTTTPTVQWQQTGQVLPAPAVYSGSLRVLLGARLASTTAPEELEFDWSCDVGVGTPAPPATPIPFTLIPATAVPPVVPPTPAPRTLVPPPPPDAVFEYKVGLFSNLTLEKQPYGFNSQIAAILNGRGVFVLFSDTVVSVGIPPGVRIEGYSREGVKIWLAGEGNPKGFPYEVSFAPDQRALPDAPGQIRDEGSKVAAGAALVASAAAVTTAAGVGHLPRLMMIASAFQCPSDDYFEVDWMTHPLSLLKFPDIEIGGFAPLAPHVSAFTCGYILIGGMLFIQCAAGAIMRCVRRRKKLRWAQVFAIVGMPHYVAPLYAFICPGLAVTTFQVMLYHPDSFAQIYAGISFFVLCLWPVGYVMYVVMGRSFKALLAQSEEDGCFTVFLLGRFEWIAKDETFTGRYGLLFEDYFAHVKWFLAGELAVSILFGMLEGIRPGTMLACKWRAWCMLVVNTAHLGCLVVMRPLLSFFEALYAVFLSMLAEVLLVLVVINQHSGDKKHWTVETAGGFALSALWAIRVKCLLDVLVLLFECWIGRHSVMVPDADTDDEYEEAVRAKSRELEMSERRAEQAQDDDGYALSKLTVFVGDKPISTDPQLASMKQPPHRPSLTPQKVSLRPGIPPPPMPHALAPGGRGAGGGGGGGGGVSPPPPRRMTFQQDLGLAADRQSSTVFTDI